MAGSNFRPGDKVKIVAGLYRTFGHGTYLRPYGTKMCTVKLDGDKASGRNVRLTSISKVEEEEDSDAVVVLTKTQYNDLMKDIMIITEALHKLQEKVKAFENSC
jgi:hypothetical protein